MTFRQYKRAIGIISRLMTLDPDPWTTEGRTLRLLAELAEEWEIEHIESSTFPVGKLKVVDDFLPLPDQLILKKEIKK